MANNIVLYFSRSGNTKKAAEYISKKLGADLVELKTKMDYPEDYDTLVKVAEKQISDDEHPEIATSLDLSEYDTVYLGFPTWYQQPPMIVHSFFDQFDLTGKNLVPFVTSVSSTIADSTSYLKKMCDSEVLRDGFTANSFSDIDDFLK
ncbi:flavodoxin [Companilactobacillus mishanensis]|uniref:Flavodoxin-like domain-containing protein n=1 Tax=Companilactobacillus mishanensis TaxID=2486008 RepID=A0ABW9P9W0_9LACO|nr:flavodoxin [Companilactobacillus mishanensis]MQS46010.1 hypothetical protein [Companilactobacillus mishanensis]